MARAYDMMSSYGREVGCVKSGFGLVSPSGMVETARLEANKVWRKDRRGCGHEPDVSHSVPFSRLPGECHDR